MRVGRVIMMVLSLPLVFVAGRWSAGRREAAVTVCGRDTVTVVRDVYRTDTIVQVVSSAVVRYDTIYSSRSDTVYVSVPITHTHHTAANCDIWVTGYKTHIDSVKVHTTETVREVTTTVVQPSPRYSIAAGVDAGVTYIGAVTIKHIALTGEIERGRLKAGVKAGLALQEGVHPYIAAGVQYDLFNKKFK